MFKIDLLLLLDCVCVHACVSLGISYQLKTWRESVAKYFNVLAQRVFQKKEKLYAVLLKMPHSQQCTSVQYSVLCSQVMQKSIYTLHTFATIDKWNKKSNKNNKNNKNYISIGRVVETVDDIQIASTTYKIFCLVVPSTIFFLGGSHLIRIIQWNSAYALIFISSEIVQKN